VPRRTLCFSSWSASSTLRCGWRSMEKQAVGHRDGIPPALCSSRTFIRAFLQVGCSPLVLHCRVTVLATRGHPPFNSSSKSLTFIMAMLYGRSSAVSCFTAVHYPVRLHSEINEQQHGARHPPSLSLMIRQTSSSSSIASAT